MDIFRYLRFRRGWVDMFLFLTIHMTKHLLFQHYRCLVVVSLKMSELWYGVMSTIFRTFQVLRYIQIQNCHSPFSWRTLTAKPYFNIELNQISLCSGAKEAKCISESAAELSTYIFIFHYTKQAWIILKDDGTKWVSSKKQYFSLQYVTDQQWGILSNYTERVKIAVEERRFTHKVFKALEAVNVFTL